MRKIGMVGLAAWLSVGSALAEPPAGQTGCIADRDALLALDYWTFDQAPEGWRVVADIPGCEMAAADLIRDYHAVLRERAEPVIAENDGQPFEMSSDGEVGILYWHEGQLRALADDRAAASELFRKSLKPQDRNYLGWNQYALASIAFLERDYHELELQRDQLAARVPADYMNLKVVDRLIDCFGLSYRAAYGSQSCHESEEMEPATAD